jgi:CDP-diacylglycerol--inositol 3-phosphatidyltransferase
VLFVFCALNETFFIALYLLSFSSPFLSPGLLQQVPESAAAAISRGDQVNPLLLGQIFSNPYSAGALELARANKMVGIRISLCLLIGHTFFSNEHFPKTVIILRI